MISSPPSTTATLSAEIDRCATLRADRPPVVSPGQIIYSSHTYAIYLHQQKCVAYDATLPEGEGASYDSTASVASTGVPFSSSWTSWNVIIFF